MMSEQSQPSIASLTQELSLLTEGKKHWEAETSEALRQSTQALRDYASVLRTTLSQVEAAAALLEEDCAHRVEDLFDEPMEELRRNITAIRDDFGRSLKVGMTSSPLHRAVPERVLPMCASLETYASVNGEVMRLPPDVMEGIIPMVGRGERVFYREMTYDDVNRWRNLDRNFTLPGKFSNAELTSILQQHNWCVHHFPNGARWGDLQVMPDGLWGGLNFYDNSGNERTLLIYRCQKNITIKISFNREDESLAIPIVENLLEDIRQSFKRPRLD